jgi:hypothetical protein
MEAATATTTLSIDDDEKNHHHHDHHPPTTTRQPSLPETALRLHTTRLRDSAGYTGTIVYYGPVASSKSASKLYYGVRWDDSTRGKHNGSVICRRTNQLVQHFVCETATGGSFCLPHTVDLGQPLTLQLLVERYQDEQFQLEQHTVSTVRGRSKPIEFVGQEKIVQQQQLIKLNAVSLRRMGIQSVPPLIESADLLLFRSVQHLQQIDLGGNLLCDWVDVQRLLSHFPNVQHLSLASNRMVTDSSDWLEKGDEVFDTLLHLNVRATSSSWQTIVKLARVLPQLDEFCCAYNNLQDMLDSTDDENGLETVHGSSFSSVTWMDVTGCRLDERHLIKLAAHFPNLESCSLDENPITKWPKDVSFTKLKHLQLANTMFTDWADLEEINQLPNLTSLRLRNCPLLENMGELQTRSLAIARFPRLTKFNASFISEQERQEAERYYLLTVSRDIHQAESLSVMNSQTGNDNNITASAAPDKISIRDQILAKHPQYTALLVKYPDISARLNADRENNSHPGNGSRLLSDSVINVTIRSLASQSCTMEPLMRRLPNQLTVGRLKALCARQFGLDIDLQSLLFRHQSSSLPTTMTEDDKSLDFYGVCDGAEILMNEIDVQALEMERRRVQEESEKRVLRQEAQLRQFQERKEMASRQ